MSSSERGRYVRRNAVDYIAIVLSLLLLLSVGARFITGKIDARQDTAKKASAVFVLYNVERENAEHISALNVPFLFSDNGTTLGEVTFREKQPSLNQVAQEDGTFLAVPSETHYDLYFTLQAEGTQAKDGSFLLGGVRRLAPGDRFPLSIGDGRYESEFLSLQFL